MKRHNNKTNSTRRKSKIKSVRKMIIGFKRLIFMLLILLLFQISLPFLGIGIPWLNFPFDYLTNITSTVNSTPSSTTQSSVNLDSVTIENTLEPAKFNLTYENPSYKKLNLTPTPTPSPIPTLTPCPTPTPTPSPTPTPTPSPTLRPTSTINTTSTPRPTFVPTILPTPVVTPTISLRPIPTMNSVDNYSSVTQTSLTPLLIEELILSQNNTYKSNGIEYIIDKDRLNIISAKDLVEINTTIDTLKLMKALKINYINIQDLSVLNIDSLINSCEDYDIKKISTCWKRDRIGDHYRMGIVMEQSFWSIILNGFCNYDLTNNLY